LKKPFSHEDLQNKKSHINGSIISVVNEGNQDSYKRNIYFVESTTNHNQNTINKNDSIKILITKRKASKIINKARAHLV
jgi:hypothetical protein